MLEALQTEKITEKLQNSGYEQGIYVYSMHKTSIPYILNFTKEGIAFLELDSMCNKYLQHSFVAVKNIEGISFRKNTLIHTLTICTVNGDVQQFNVSSRTAGASWQKENVIKAQELLQSYFPQSQSSPIKKSPVKLLYVLIPLLAIGVFIGFFRTAPPQQGAETQVVGAENAMHALPRVPFVEFSEAYNAIFSGIPDMEITDWSITHGEITDRASFQGINHAFMVIMHRESPQYVREVLFMFQNTDSIDTMLNLYRKQALIMVFEPGMDGEDAEPFLLQIMQAGENGLVSQSGISYFFDMLSHVGAALSIEL